MTDSVSYRHDNRTMWVDARLGPAMARKLLNGRVPNLSYAIVGRSPCKFTEGEVIVIDPHRLWITISTVRARHGKWQVEYVLADHRPRLLGKKVGYTHNPRQALRTSYRDEDGDLHDELEVVGSVEKVRDAEASESEIRRLKRQLRREREKVEKGDLARARIDRLQDEIERLSSDRAAYASDASPNI